MGCGVLEELRFGCLYVLLYCSMMLTRVRGASITIVQSAPDPQIQPTAGHRYLVICQPTPSCNA